MNKHVFKKIAELEKTELSDVKIDLVSAVDLSKLYAAAISVNKDLFGDTYKKVDALKVVLNQKETNALKMISDLDGAMIDYSKKAKELGLDAEFTPLYNNAKKELDDLYKGVKLVQKFVNGLKA